MLRFGLPVPLLLSCSVVLVGCGGSTQPPEERAASAATSAADVGAHMTEHFARVREIEEAVIRGDLEAARAPAQWIVEHQEVAGLPAGSETFLNEVSNGARGVASTESLGNAAVATASMVSACGACHAAVGATPKLPVPTIPAEAAGTARHMREHQRAVDLMYEGLIAPSEELWKQGAEALKAAPLSDKDLPEVATEVANFEARVHELADRAANAPDARAKVAIYGEILGGCASCHGRHGKVWGPGLPKSQ